MLLALQSEANGTAEPGSKEAREESGGPLKLRVNKPPHSKTVRCDLTHTVKLTAMVKAAG